MSRPKVSLNLKRKKLAKFHHLNTWFPAIHSFIDAVGLGKEGYQQTIHDHVSVKISFDSAFTLEFLALTVFDFTKGEMRYESGIFTG